MKYRLEGYDKDTDDYILILAMQERELDKSGEALNRLIKIGRELKTDLEKDRIINPYTGEPLDWLQVVDENYVRICLI